MNNIEQERTKLSILQRKLLNGSLSMDYAEVVKIKEEIHESMKKIKALDKKLKEEDKDFK